MNKVRQPEEQDHNQPSQSLESFEALLRRSAPQPRAGFEDELAQRLYSEIRQHRQARRTLTVQQRPGSATYYGLVALAALVVFVIGTLIAASIAQQIRPSSVDETALRTGRMSDYSDTGLSKTIDGLTVMLRWSQRSDGQMATALTIRHTSSDMCIYSAREPYRIRLYSRDHVETTVDDVIPCSGKTYFAGVHDPTDHWRIEIIGLGQLSGQQQSSTRVFEFLIPSYAEPDAER